MDTLRLTTLSLLIPLGWAVSADAHSQALDEFDPAQKRILEPTCGAQSQSQAVLRGVQQNPDRFRDSPETMRGNDHTKSFPEDRKTRTGFCQVVLDLTDINVTQPKETQ